MNVLLMTGYELFHEQSLQLLKFPVMFLSLGHILIQAIENKNSTCNLRRNIR